VPPQRLPHEPAPVPPGPTSGSQLYRQRQVALQSGQLYTRLPVESFADQWRTATRQPTYQDWMTLLRREARAIANGQGQNRLEVILGDSLGLWLPPDTLPRDRLWLNQSISGETSVGILRRLNAFAATRPTVIHLMVGVNDLKNNVPEAEIVSLTYIPQVDK
jgi:lysophospholipase L1-like esterase